MILQVDLLFRGGVCLIKQQVNEDLRLQEMQVLLCSFQCFAQSCILTSVSLISSIGERNYKYFYSSVLTIVQTKLQNTVSASENVELSA